MAVETRRRKEFWEMTRVEVSTSIDIPFSLDGGVDSLWIGQRRQINGCFDGMLDEIRVSGVARSADWIEASYMSGSNTLLKMSVVVPSVDTLSAVGILMDKEH